jgi:hypothetical protein
VAYRPYGNGKKKKEAGYFLDEGSTPHYKSIPVNRRQEIKTLGSRLWQKGGAPPRELSQWRQAQLLADRLLTGSEEGAGTGGGSDAKRLQAAGQIPNIWRWRNIQSRIASNRKRGGV